jgi:hypothetical protein
MIAVTCEQPVDERDSAPAIFAINTFTTYSSSDYNGFRPNAGAPYLFASRNRIDADFRGSASMAGVGRDDGEAALEAGVPKRSGVAADGGRDDTVVAAAAPVEKPSAPRGRRRNSKRGSFGLLSAPERRASRPARRSGAG